MNLLHREARRVGYPPRFELSESKPLELNDTRKNEGADQKDAPIPREAPNERRPSIPRSVPVASARPFTAAKA